MVSTLPAGVDSVNGPSTIPLARSVESPPDSGNGPMTTADRAESEGGSLAIIVLYAVFVAFFAASFWLAG
jgi:hypothetical protein